MNHLIKQLEEIFDATKQHLSNIKPSEWYEKHMVMPPGSAFPGKFSFNLTPYWREPLDCADPLHPAKEVSIMKGAQLGGTAAVLNPIVGYTIAKHPGNIMFLTGHSDLSEAAMLKIDQMIDNCGIRDLISPNVLRKKNSRSGDTNKSKEFSGGDLKSGSVTNHNLLRQHDVMIMIVDDYDAAPSSSKHAGSTRELVQKRTSAYAHKKKIYWVSSPQIKGASNIEDVFLLGDQRYYHVPCPKCGEFIKLEWQVAIEGTDGKEMGGIYWKRDKIGRVERSSVGYVCQKCSGFFDDSHKYEMNLAGFWQPSVEMAKEEDHYSYQISSLYAPPGMDSWAYYAQQFENANPDKGKRNEKKHQTFMNVVLGEPYKQQGSAPEANQLQKNIRNYAIKDVPDKMSVDDGNGHIVLLTCACDLNGVLDDARLDYEIVGWSESGSNYSILQGSIGTFIPREGTKKKKVDRERWTYEHNKTNSVWPEFEKILGTKFDAGNRKMEVFISGVDTGHYTEQAYEFIDKTNFRVVGLKGKDEDKFMRIGVDLPTFKHAKERSNLYLVEVNMIKDRLAHDIDLKWDYGNDDRQPAGFMNFPTPSDGLYLFNNFFSHYESEHRIIEQKEDKTVATRWVKKSSTSQNHFWDVRVYNIVIKDILTWMVCKELKIKEYTWQDYVDAVMKMVKG